MSLSSHLRTLIEPHKEPKYAAWQTNYMRNQFPFLGIRAPLLKQAVRQMRKIQPSVNWKEEVLDLWNQPEREFKYAALQWAVYAQKQAVAEDLAFYEKLVVSHSWWDTVDTIAPQLIGPLLQRFPDLVAKSESWLESDHLWLRRTALIYALKWKKKTDAKRLFSYCTKLAGDPDFFIRKAIGWVLREYSKTNQAAVKAYLEGVELSPLSVREAKKHFT